LPLPRHSPPLFPYTTLFRSSLRQERAIPLDRPGEARVEGDARRPPEQLPGATRVQVLVADLARRLVADIGPQVGAAEPTQEALEDRKSTRLNSSHGSISYAV